MRSDVNGDRGVRGWVGSDNISGMGCGWVGNDVNERGGGDNNAGVGDKEGGMTEKGDRDKAGGG